MSTRFQPGDFLVFQLEAGYSLLRLLEIEDTGTDAIWHVAGYDDFFLDVETAEVVSANTTKLTLKDRHIALTTRAFESTQVATISNQPLTAEDLEPIAKWRTDPDRKVSDRSIRLMLGLR